MKKLFFLFSFLMVTIGFGQTTPKYSVTVDVVKYREVPESIRDQYVVPVGERWKLWNVTADREEQWNGSAWVTTSAANDLQLTGNEVSLTNPITPGNSVTVDPDPTNDVEVGSNSPDQNIKIWRGTKAQFIIDDPVNDPQYANGIVIIKDSIVPQNEGVIFKQVTLTDLDYDTSTNIQLISAPGAGKVIVLHKYIIKINVTSVYTPIGSNPFLYMGWGATNYEQQFVVFHTYHYNNVGKSWIWANSTAGVPQFANASGRRLTDIENVPFTLTLDDSSTSISGGAGTIEINIWYSIEDI